MIFNRLQDLCAERKAWDMSILRIAAVSVKPCAVRRREALRHNWLGEIPGPGVPDTVFERYLWLRVQVHASCLEGGTGDKQVSGRSRQVAADGGLPQGSFEALDHGVPPDLRWLSSLRMA